MKFKKIMSAVLATAMVMSMSVMSASAAGTFVPTEDGTYTSTTVTALNYYTPTNASMCNGVFAGEVDLTIAGEWAELKLYVCNPTPGQWGGLETGLLSNATITYDGVAYTGELTSIGMTDENAAEKLYTQDSSFFGIEAGTVNKSDTLEFTIPTEALASNLDISAFVNLVMNSQQSFWLDIDFVEPTVDTTPDADVDTEVTTQDVDVYATVLANESTYSVVVPEEITFGDLATNEDTVVKYEVEVSEFVKGNDNASVQVESENGVITAEETTIDFANSFGTQTANEATTLLGELTVKAADVAAAPAGDYAGTVTFAISTVK